MYIYFKGINTTNKYIFLLVILLIIVRARAHVWVCGCVGASHYWFFGSVFIVGKAREKLSNKAPWPSKQTHMYTSTSTQSAYTHTHTTLDAL